MCVRVVPVCELIPAVSVAGSANIFAVKDKTPIFADGSSMCVNLLAKVVALDKIIKISIDKQSEPVKRAGKKTTRK